MCIAPPIKVNMNVKIINYKIIITLLMHVVCSKLLQICISIIVKYFMPMIVIWFKNFQEQTQLLEISNQPFSVYIQTSKNK